MAVVAAGFMIWIGFGLDLDWGLEYTFFFFWKPGVGFGNVVDTSLFLVHHNIIVSTHFYSCHCSIMIWLCGGCQTAKVSAQYGQAGPVIELKMHLQNSLR